MRHLLPVLDMSVIAPIPYFPAIKAKTRWSEYTIVPHHERFAGFSVHHPRYLVIPKVGMATHGLSMFAGSLPEVRRQVRATDYDLIDAHYVYPDGFAATLLGKLFQKPVVVSARGTDINQFPEYRTIRPMVRQVLRAADGLIAVAQSLKDVMVDLGAPDEKVTVIGNGVDAEKFSPADRGEMRQRLGLPPNRPIVISVGHLTERKGFHILIKAIAALRSRRPDALLVIVGEGEERGRLEKLIRMLNVQDNVLLAGACLHERLSPWYNAADLFCLASSREGWPNVVLEAMACGCPVIATRVWGAPEIVVSPSLGSLVDGTPEAFEAAIDQALKRRWDRDTIIAHARSHGWDKVAAKVLDVYSQVLARRNHA